jgi:thiamine-monophosphate kinase
LTRSRMERPTPRVALGLALRGIASSAIDVSDGLLGDFSHVLKASRLGADIDLNAIDSIALSADFIRAKSQFDIKILRQMVLAGGDDYELVFTAPVAQRDAVQQAALSAHVQVTRIGCTTAKPGLRLRESDGSLAPNDYASFDHFKT